MFRFIPSVSLSLPGLCRGKSGARMEIGSHRVGDVIVLKIATEPGERGRIDGVQSLVRGHLGSGVKNFVIDLSACEWMDSSGLGELVKSLATVMRQGGVMKLSGASPRLTNLLDVTNLTSILDLYPDEETALASITR